MDLKCPGLFVAPAVIAGWNINRETLPKLYERHLILPTLKTLKMHQHVPFRGRRSEDRLYF